MVEILVVGDIHLKLRKHADFERRRFNLLIDTLAKSPQEIIIINGDLFDSARPTLEEIGAVQRALRILNNYNKVVYIISGNHENVTKDKTTYDIMRFDVVYVDKPMTFYENGKVVRLCSHKDIGKLHLGEPCDILISHYRSKMEGLYDEEVDTSFTKDYDLVILSDIHSRYHPSDNVYYTSSPYPTHYIRDSREEYGYMVVNVDDKTFKYITLNLPKKIRLDIKYEDLPEVKINPEHLYKLHVSGTLDELRNVPTWENVTVVKEVLKIDTQAVTTKDVDFFDLLTTQVNEQLRVKTSKTKEILVRLQE